MNPATFSAMSRLFLYRQKHLIMLSRMNDSLAKMSLANAVVTKRFASSSTPTTTDSSPTIRYGTGEFGRPTPTPRDVVLPPLLPEDESGPDENPYKYSQVYRKSRFDWLFGDGWRRPPAHDQGQRLRRDWIAFGYHPTDEYMDWKTHHYFMFHAFTLIVCGTAFFFYYCPDWHTCREWATREAYIEMARREKYGLPYISKDYIDPKKVTATLPSEEELGDFEIII